MKLLDIKTELLWHRAFHRGMQLSYEQARKLLRYEATLHRWDEECCGTEHWHIERNDDGVPFRVHSSGHMFKIPDKQAATLKHVTALCEEAGIHYYHQADPRGCALYISKEPMDGSNYSTKGLGCSI